MPEIEQEKEYLQEPLKPIKPEERAKIISDKTKTSNLEDDIRILKTVGAIPTETPQSGLEKIQIYISGTTRRLYVWEDTNKVWRYVSLPSDSLYFVGNSSRDNVEGTQAITGVGFTPKLIKIMAVYDGAIPGAWSNGRATSTTNEYCIYYKANGDTSYSSGKIIDVLGTGLNQASLSAIGTDGFTLNWTESYDTISFSYECYA